MIAPLSVEVGRPVRFEGYAEDYGVPIVTVQFSLDDGENWTDYDVSGSTGDRWCTGPSSTRPRSREPIACSCARSTSAAR